MTNEQNETKTIKLLKPIKNGNEVIQELTLKEPTLGDLEVMDSVSGEIKKMKILLAKLSGLETGVIEKLSGRDFKAISAEVNDFLGV